MNVQCKFPQYSSRTGATTSPKDKKYGPFRVKGRRKNTRTIVHGQYRHETGNSTNKTNRKDTWTNLVPFFRRVGPLKATFEHHTGQRGADRCFEEGWVDDHSALVRHTRTHLQPKTNGNTPQLIVRTRDLERLYSPCGADERAKIHTVTTIAVEVDPIRWTKLHSSAIKSH